MIKNVIFGLLFFMMCSRLMATALPNGGVIAAAISTPMGQDTYTFTAQAGETFRVSIADTSVAQELAPHFEVFDPDSIFVVSGGNPTVGTNAAIASKTGTYTVVVSDQSSGNDATGSYNIYFVKSLGANEGGALPNGGSINDTIALGDLDSYTFDAVVGETFRISVADVNFSGVRPSFAVYGPDGIELVDGENPTVATNSAVANISGTHTVIVRDESNGNDATGDYRIYFAKSPGANEGGVLPNGGSISDTIDLGDLDSYTFDAVVGETFRISVADINFSGMNPRFHVYDPDGIELVGGGNPTVGTNTAVANKNGTYSVLIRDGSNGNDASGDYNIYFAKAPGASEGGALSDNITLNGVIDLGDLDSFTFNTLAGQFFSLSVTDTSSSGLWSPSFSVYDPDGAVLLNGSGPTVASNSTTTTKDGSYTIIIRDSSNGNDAEGAYSMVFTADFVFADNGINVPLPLWSMVALFASLLLLQKLSGSIRHLF